MKFCSLRLQFVGEVEQEATGRSAFAGEVRNWLLDFSYLAAQLIENVLLATELFRLIEEVEPKC